MNKRTLIAITCMLVGGILVVTGLLDVPKITVVKILIGGALGFGGYKIYETRRREAPDDLELG